MTTENAALVSSEELFQLHELDETELASRLVTRLRNQGPECLSQLAIELVTSNKRVLSVLQELEERGLVSQRPDDDPGQHALEEGEVRWGARTGKA